MSTAPEEFEQLQKLLKLKRYEQPPPGYFNNFSTLVINRLERESEKDTSDAAWVKKLMGILETNPFAAGIFGMSVCGLLISGIAWSQYRPPSESAGNDVTLTVADSGTASKVPEWSKTASVNSLAPSMAAFGTNNGALFDGISLPKAQLVIDRQ